MSVPMPKGAHLNPVEAPSPPDEPPGVRVRLCGFKVVPVMLLLQQRCFFGQCFNCVAKKKKGNTMRDWGWFVRTWKTAPAFSKHWRSKASSGAMSSILEARQLLV